MNELKDVVDSIWEIMKDNDDGDFEDWLYTNLLETRYIDPDHADGTFKEDVINITKEIIHELHTKGEYYTLENLLEKEEHIDTLVAVRQENCAHPRWACEIVDSLGCVVGWVQCSRCGATWYESMEAEL